MDRVKNVKRGYEKAYPTSINSLSFIYSYRIKKEGMNYKMKNQKRKVTKLKPKEGNQNERKSVLIKI